VSEIPNGWERATIAEIEDAVVDQGGPTGNDSFVYLDISSIDRASKRISAANLLPVESAPSRARQRVAPGDVLISMTRPNLNAVAIVEKSHQGAIASTGFHVIRSSGMNPKIIFYSVQTHEFVEAMTRLVQGALYPAVRPKDIRSYAAPIPPRAEQDRIVAQLEALLTDLDSGVAALKRVQANLKQYRASVLKAACEGRLITSECHHGN
jgi:type I restriction enzyme S subunit